MYRSKIHFFLAFLLWNYAYSFAVMYDNQVFVSYIKTVQFFPTENEMGFAAIQLNSPETLVLHFDDLSNKSKTFYYTVQQCRADWSPSDMNIMEYTEGFTESTINDYSYSNGTKVPYTHYTMTFPNNDMRISKSGNYALIVYETNKENPVFTLRFMVYEPRVSIDAHVAYPRNLSDRSKLQEVVFKVNYKNFQIDNPPTEVKAVVLQNFRWDNAKYEIRPLLFGNNELNFDFNGMLTFPSGREFRQFDTRSIRFRGQNIRALDIRDNSNDFYLLFDSPLQTYKYQYYKDLNGLYYVESYENPDYNTGADYATVHFTLGFPNLLANGNFYVVGAFNNYTCDEWSKMSYDLSDKSYNASILMKQGLYNYSYIFKDENNKLADQTITEGFYEDTENNYTVLLYYTPFGERYDRLIGIKHINSIYNRY